MPLNGELRFVRSKAETSALVRAELRYAVPSY
jgi:hypothetical protein